MTKVALIKFLLLCLFLSTTAYGQKVKYKDIFGLLSTKQYEAAEPFLKRYLKENDDNPNAYLFMGTIFHEKSGKDDILKQTERAIANMDSAIYFYDKAHKTITEKEVKKNDEYYVLYNRRDLRTGEFGVKLSDIHFDLEKKMEGLRERIDRLKMVKHYFILADTLYKKSNALFRSIQGNFKSENELYLRADDPGISTLTSLAIKFDSTTKAFENYKASLSSLGKSGYSQVMVLKEIVDFKKDGASPADFYQDELQVWNYKKFADHAKLVIEKEIVPMREHLLSYDIEINKLREKLNQDSVSVKSDLTALIDKLLMEKLKKFDPDPLPMEVFSLKISDLEYRSTVLESKILKDSSDVHAQLDQVNKESHYLGRLDSISTKMMAEDLDKKAADYNHFVVNTYSNTIVLKSYVKALNEFAERERRRIDKKLSHLKSSLQWLKVLPDSVPLFTDARQSKFKPLIVVSEKFTAGLQIKDSINADGYFYTITSSRVPDVRVTFPVDKTSFKEARMPTTKSLTYSDAAGQIYFVLVYSEKAKDGKYATTLAKIYRSDGLAWSNNYSIGFVPKEISFKQDTGELNIKNDTQLSVIDKNGKVIK